LLLPVLRALLKQKPDFEAAMPQLLCGLACLILHIVLVIVSTPAAFAASAEATAKTRRKIMARTSNLPLGWFTPERKSRLARAVTADSAKIGTLSVTIGAQAINAVFGPAALCAVAFLIDWRVAVPLAVGMLILIICLRAMMKSEFLRSIGKNLETAAADIARNAVEFGHAQPVLRAAGNTGRADERMRAAIDEHRRTYRHGLNVSIPPYLGSMAVPICAFIVTLIIGARLLFDGSISIAESVVLLILAARYVQPLGSVVDMTAALGEISSSLSRVLDILRASSLPSPGDPVTVMPDAGIEFRDVTFSYSDAGKSALRDVSFSCPPGSTTALVGASGTGKTTVTKLIARFFDVNGGSVRIGGIDVRNYEHEYILSKIAVIFQDVYLFEGTIEENLLLARPDASKGQLVAAARAARLDEVINRLPYGWQTQVGEGGALLSGGERQRVSIARAFLKDASIVLIDEAVSALDPQNERAVCEAITDLADNPERTVIIIAHHPAVLAAADRVVALDGGRVAETGAPDELLQFGGIYAKLYKQYEHARNWRIGEHT
jgi:ATP-binding cassette subfamily B protein